MDREELGTCVCCLYENVPIKEYETIKGYKYILCKICHESKISATMYNLAFSYTETRILQSLGWIANKILEEIRDGRH